MAKKKVIFECLACGYQSPKWMGKCPNCGAWNQMEETIEHKETKGPKNTFKSDVPAQKIEKLKEKYKEIKDYLDFEVDYDKYELCKSPKKIDETLERIEKDLKLIEAKKKEMLNKKVPKEMFPTRFDSAGFKHLRNIKTVETIVQWLFFCQIFNLYLA